MTSVLVRVVTLAMVYLLVLSSVRPGDVVTGLLLAGVVVAAGQVVGSRRPGPDRPPGTSPLRRLAGVPALFGGTLLAMARGSWEVATFCLSRRPPAAGLVGIPIQSCPETSAAAWAIRVGLTPDVVVVDVDEEAGSMLVHVLDARDPTAVRAEQHGSYRRHQRRVFP